MQVFHVARSRLVPLDERQYCKVVNHYWHHDLNYNSKKCNKTITIKESNDHDSLTVPITIKSLSCAKSSEACWDLSNTVGMNVLWCKRVIKTIVNWVVTTTVRWLCYLPSSYVYCILCQCNLYKTHEIKIAHLDCWRKVQIKAETWR